MMTSIYNGVLSPFDGRLPMQVVHLATSCRTMNRQSWQEVEQLRMSWSSLQNDDTEAAATIVACLGTMVGPCDRAMRTILATCKRVKVIRRLKKTTDGKYKPASGGQEDRLFETKRDANKWLLIYDLMVQLDKFSFMAVLIDLWTVALRGRKSSLRLEAEFPHHRLTQVADGGELLCAVTGKPVARVPEVMWDDFNRIDDLEARMQVYKTVCPGLSDDMVSFMEQRLAELQELRSNDLPDGEWMGMDDGSNADVYAARMKLLRDGGAPKEVVASKSQVWLMLHDVEPVIATMRMRRCPTVSAGELMQAVHKGFQHVDDALVDARNRMQEANPGVPIGTSLLMMNIRKETPATPICKITFQRSWHVLEVAMPHVGTVFRIDKGGSPMCAYVRVDDEARVAATLRNMQAGGGSLDLFKKIGALTRNCVFCCNRLSESESVRIGVGPECREKYKDVLDRFVRQLDPSEDLQRPVANDVVQIATTVHRAMPPPQERLVARVLEGLSTDESSLISTLTEMLADPDAILEKLSCLAGVELGLVGRACEDVLHMLETGIVPAYSDDSDGMRLLSAACLADPLGVAQPIATWLAWRWFTDMCWSF